jgi:arsenite transporter
MMWPILTKVQYEALPQIFRSRRIWVQIGISLLLNWIIGMSNAAVYSLRPYQSATQGPLVMLGLAWATLPDLPTYRTGVILVGLARCIAMVMVWNQLAGGDGDYCAILVVVNSILQIILYSPYALLFINAVGGAAMVHISYGDVAIAVLIVCLHIMLLRSKMTSTL